MKKSLASLLFIAIVLILSPSVLAQSAGLKGIVDTTKPTQPLLIITNSGTEACQIIQSDLGTVSVSRMVQNNTSIEAIPVKVNLNDGLQSFLEKKLSTLQPGDSVTIPLHVTTYKSKTGADSVLKSLTWSKETGPFGLLYPFQSKKPYQLDVTYASPITVSSGAPLCGIVSASTGSSGNLWEALKIPGIILLILLLIFLLLFLLRSKKVKAKNATKTAIIIFMIVSSFAGMSKPASASYSVPESALAQFDECMALFARYPDITNPILDAIDNQEIIIDVNHSGENLEELYPDGTHHIDWDAFNTYNYPYDDGTPIVSTPCDRLFHELYHVADEYKGSVDGSPCAGGPIPTREVDATRAQNRLRVAMGLTPRTHYDNDHLPPGDCHEAPDAPPPPIATCGFSCASGWGDPHIITFDQHPYDFQAAGEFVAARSKDSLEVQTRQEPWPNSRYVSMNTAVAMKVGANKVELQMYQGKLTLLLNGKRLPLETTSLPGGGAVTTNSAKQAVVTWPDGTILTVNSIGTVGISIYLNPAENLVGKFEGILATEGQPDTWRVTDETSLFTYEAGKNTASYTIKGFPDIYAIPQDIPNRAAAEAICKALNVTDPTILQNCITDVGFTGRPEFAETARQFQSVFLNKPGKTVSKKSSGGQVLNLTITKKGEEASAPFEGKAGDKIFVNILSSSFQNQCGDFGIKDATGSIISTGCITDGTGFADTTELPTSGTYSFFILPANNQTGKITAEIIKAQDVIMPIQLGGPAITADLSKPGSTAKLSFQGTQGQRVFVEIPSTTVPDQCGGVSIQTLDGGAIASTCISNGKAIFDEKGTILPKTDTYTIVIDPGEDRTGVATVKAGL